VGAQAKAETRLRIDRGAEMTGVTEHVVRRLSPSRQRRARGSHPCPSALARPPQSDGGCHTVRDVRSDNRREPRRMCASAGPSGRLACSGGAFGPPGDPRLIGAGGGCLSLLPRVRARARAAASRCDKPQEGLISSFHRPRREFWKPLRPRRRRPPARPRAGSPRAMNRGSPRVGMH
jgi:hypothetical protein